MRRLTALALIALGFLLALLAERLRGVGERISPSRPQTRVRSFVKQESILGDGDTTEPGTAFLDTLKRRPT
jgi:hypothetical protein